MRICTTFLFWLFAAVAIAADAGNFKVIVYNKMNRETLSGAEVKLQDIASGRTYSQTTGYDGSASFQIDNAAKYRLEISKDATGSSIGFLSYTYMLSEKEVASGRTFEAELEKVKHEQSGLMPAMYFEYNRYTLTEDHKQMLDNLLKMFGGFPTLQVEVGVYADCREGKDVTTQRAKQIANYLAGKGDNKKVIVKEYGAVRALNHCDCSNEYVVCSEQKYLENRRAEFKILSF